MTPPEHGFRSWLFVPGDSEKKLAKALQSAADVLILDLEDAVGPASKASARTVCAQALAMQARPARYVRVNGLSTGMTMDDVASTIGANPDGYVLPKCEGPDDIEALARIVAACGSTPKGILAICTETVRGVRRLMREDWSHPSLVGLTWGGEDLRVDLSAMANRDLQGNYLSPFVAARDLALLAAKEARVLAIDAVFTDFGDEAGLVRETRNARDMGFDGKLAIHPVQLQPIRDSFAPSEAEIAWAHGVIAAIGDGQSGVGRLDGVMVDRPHLKLAEKILGSADV